MLSAGTTLGGRYRLDERIAGGGMGDVWRGTDEVLGRTVAVKVLLPALLEEPGFAERFRGEARTMATINHPGVVDVYDYGSEGATAFLIMEYVEGDALSRTLGRVGRLTPARTMALMAQAADALHAAHEKGIVHRDVKPGNLLVRPNGTLVLTDFGIARSAMVGQLTAAGSVLGTASYISPEQASGSGATPLSDVYSLGVVAYQCLAGRRPYEGENPLEIAMRHVRDAPPPLPADIPPAVRQIVERSMAKDPAARWPTAAALAQSARRVSGQLTHGGGASAPLPPVAPVSPGVTPTPPPISSVPTGPPVPVSPVVPGGTRVMSGPGAGPVSGPPVHSPISPAIAHQARGSAGVAPPPPPADTGYTQYAPMPPQGGGGGGGRTGLVVTAVVLAALVAIMGAVGIVYALASNDDTPNTPGGQTSRTPTPVATTPGPTATGANVNIDCEALRGKTLQEVRDELSKIGIRSTVTYVDARDGAKPDEVVGLSQCGQTRRGATIRLQVVRGASGSPTRSGTPAPGLTCPGGGIKLPFSPCPTASN
jgi:serine/threonine-protein kinase